MYDKLELILLIFAVAISSIFPCKILWKHFFATTTESSITTANTSQKPLVFKDAAPVMDPEIRKQATKKRLFAIKEALSKGTKEYTFRIIVPPPPIGGQ